MCQMIIKIIDLRRLLNSKNITDVLMIFINSKQENRSLVAISNNFQKCENVHELDEIAAVYFLRMFPLV